MDVCEVGRMCRINSLSMLKWNLIHEKEDDYLRRFFTVSVVLGPISIFINFCLFIVITRAQFRSLFLNLHFFIKVLTLVEFLLVLFNTIDKSSYIILMKLHNCISSCAILIFFFKILNSAVFAFRNGFFILINFLELRIIFSNDASTRTLGSPRKFHFGVIIWFVACLMISVIFYSIPIYKLRCSRNNMRTFFNYSTTEWYIHESKSPRKLFLALFILNSSLPFFIVMITGMFIILHLCHSRNVFDGNNFYIGRNEVITKTVIGLNINCLIFQFVINITTFLCYFISKDHPSYQSIAYVAEILKIIQGNFNVAIYAYVYTPLMFDNFKDLKSKNQIYLQNL